MAAEPIPQGGWHDHNSHEPPVNGGSWVAVIDRLSGIKMTGPANEFCWENVVKFRVHCASFRP
jgi:hypothetical protein